MAEAKLKSLVACLNDKRVEQVLGTEAELALAWAFDRLFCTEFEPVVPGKRRGPDLKVSRLVGDADAWVEITAVSDANFSGDAAMKPIVQAITSFANSIRKGVGKHLSFEFDEAMGYENGKFFRRLLAPVGFSLDAECIEAFTNWIRNVDKSNAQPLFVDRPGLKLRISYRPYALKHLDYRGRMVPAFYDPEDNPIYRRLDDKKKRGQLPIGKTDDICGIILWDAGCWAMQNTGLSSPHSVSVSQIARRFIEKSKIDFVAIFSPWRRHGFLRQGPSVVWRTNVFAAVADGRLSAYESAMDRVSKALPHPRFEGYQARSYQERKLYDPQSQGWYLAPTLTTLDKQMTVRVSARALHDALARQDFKGVASRYATGGDGTNFFAMALREGRVIKSCRVEPGSVDEDDDYLVFEFGEDPAASKFVARKGGDETS